jgi:hypothetical protein
MEVVDLDVAKAHLRINSDHADSDIQLKLDLAHGIVEDYILSTDVRRDGWAAEIATWDDETAPKQVVAAVLCQLEELWRFRGGTLDGEMPKRERGELSPQVESYLRRTRDPVVS